MLPTHTHICWTDKTFEKRFKNENTTKMGVNVSMIKFLKGFVKIKFKRNQEYILAQTKNNVKT
jgi:hypothetical protein